LKLQINTRLALYSVLEFAADPGRQIAAAEIAERYGVSAHHLAKVLSELARVGIVESTRGVGGGYRFAGNAKRLTLMDVIQVFEDPGGGEAAHRDAAAETPVGRALGVVLAEIDEIAAATFATITLDTMLRLIARQREQPRTDRGSQPRAAGASSRAYRRD
jgi:Rrf2 family protein